MVMLNRFALSKLECAALVLFIFISLSACAKEVGMILELEDVQFFKVEEVSSSQEKIHISGLVFHSALGIREITTTKKGDSLQLLVQLAPANETRSGNLDYELTIPPAIQSVTFGAEEKEIWNRKTAGYPQPSK